MSNIDYMKNIALKNKIIKEENEDDNDEDDDEDDEEEDDDDDDENEEDRKTWIKVKDKLNDGVIFPWEILKDNPSFYENYKDKILTCHLKHITIQTENKFQKNISDTFINNVSISNSINSFSIILKSKITLPGLSAEGLQKLRNSHFIVHSD
jgi:hypothetical protein